MTATARLQPTLRKLQSVSGGYQNPVAPEILGFQIELAIREASDLDFISAALRERSTPLVPRV